MCHCDTQELTGIFTVPVATNRGPASSSWLSVASSQLINLNSFISGHSSTPKEPFKVGWLTNVGAVIYKTEKQKLKLV